ncbi:MAG: 50S ribosomal protein L25 [Nitrospiraceae bacterium]
MKFEMAAEIRTEAGKGVARRLRRNGKVPAVLYGQGECLLLTLRPDALRKLLRTHGGSTTLLTLSITGGTSRTTRSALVRDYQVDPVTGQLLHADLFEVSMDKPIRIKVPVSIVGGVPKGVKEGGVIHHNLRELHVECLPAAIPDRVEVDASDLEIGQGVHVRELKPLEGIRFLEESDQMVVSVAAPISEAKLEALLTSGAVVEEGKEPEVIGKGKEEDVVEPAEKEAAPAEPKAEKKDAQETQEETKK